LSFEFVTGTATFPLVVPVIFLNPFIRMQMKLTILPRWIFPSAAGPLVASLAMVSSSCEKPQQSGNGGSPAESTRTASAKHYGLSGAAEHGMAANLKPADADAGGAELPPETSLSTSGQGAAKGTQSASHAGTASAPSVARSSNRDKAAKSHPAPEPGLADDGDALEPETEEAPVMGVRLAPDVRLPVAAMPIDFTISPVAEEARQQIVRDYYREVAQAVSNPGEAVNERGAGNIPADGNEPGNDGSGQVTDTGVVGIPSESTGSSGGEVIEDGEEGPTLIVSNRPEVEAARQRADERFRALFGADAYNRMVMQSLIESRLPDQAAAESANSNRHPLTDGD
jgi:hypothetical protein